MSSLEEIRRFRLEKLERLKERNINPYPSETHQTHTIEEIEKVFELGLEATIVGRVMALRPQGALAFIQLFDGTGKLQCLLKEESIGDEFRLFINTVDVGDFVEVSGALMKTKTDQETLEASSWRMLTKTLAPLPDKWHGLKDDEERYRKRYLDILFNPDLRATFEKKVKFWAHTRTFLEAEGFLHVETPTLELTTGGAEATPFVTHHNDFDLDLYLRISVGELWQKRLMAAGFPKTYEIGRVYRNEGSSPDHLQEFTGFEFYWAYADYRMGMEMTERMIKDVVEKTFGTLTFKARGYEFDMSGEWKKIDYVEKVEEITGVNVIEADEETMKAKLQELGVEYDGENKERLTDTLWKYCRKKIAGPAWLINHPKLVSPLAKELEDKPGRVERAQLILAGSEVANGYSELNDPVEQHERFNLQQELIEGGDDEAMMADHEFVEMLEHGMPPTFGFAYGERLFSILMNESIRETTLFPLVKPKGNEKKSKENEKKN